VAWLLGLHPEWQIAIASYGAELDRDVHRETFPNCRLLPNSAAAHRFELTRGGGARFVGRGGALLGTGAHLFEGEAATQEGRCAAIPAGSDRR
jgi:hypothetical protein